MAIAGDLAKRVAKEGGAALVIDYGRDRLYPASLAAIREHGFVNMLSSPGTADLSAHVDFSALRCVMPTLSLRKVSCSGCSVRGLVHTEVIKNAQQMPKSTLKFGDWKVRLGSLYCADICLYAGGSMLFNLNPCQNGRDWDITRPPSYLPFDFTTCAVLNGYGCYQMCSCSRYALSYIESFADAWMPNLQARCPGGN